jgi:hypothetical protein
MMSNYLNIAREVEFFDYLERSQISVSCTIVLWFSLRLPLSQMSLRYRVWVAIIILALLPLALTLTWTTRQNQQLFPLSELLIHCFYPSLLVFAPTVFAWRASRRLLNSAGAITTALQQDRLCNGIEQWNKEMRPHRQIWLYGFIIALVGALAGSGALALLGYDMSVMGLQAAIAFFYSGFFMGLGFSIGALSPRLVNNIVSRCELRLQPFAPATTPEIISIARDYAMMVFEGSLVGLVLSPPLLYVGTLNGDVSLRFLFFLSMITGWLTVLFVFGKVQYDLHKSILRAQKMTRIQLRELIVIAYQELGNRDKENLDRLQKLVELDASVQGSTYALNISIIIRALSSLLIPAIPFLLNVFI